MKALYFLLSLMLLWPYTGMAKKHGNATWHDVRVADWTSLSVAGPYDVDVHIRPDSVGHVRVLAEQRDFDHMQIVAEGGNLTIRDRSNKSNGTKITGNNNIVTINGKRVSPDSYTYSSTPRVIVYTDGRIDAVALSGSGDIDLPALNISATFNLSLTGSGDIDIASISAAEFNALLTGSGDIKLRQVNARTNVTLSLVGSGDFDVKRLKAQRVNVRLQGSGDIDLQGQTTKANLVLTGSGDIDAANLRTTELNAIASGSGGITFGEARKVTTSGKNIRQSKKIKH